MEIESIELEFLLSRDEIRRDYLRQIKKGLGRFLAFWVTLCGFSLMVMTILKDFAYVFASIAIVAVLVPLLTLWTMYKSYMSAATAAYEELWTNGGVIRMKFVNGAAGFESSLRDDHAYTSWNSVSSVEELPEGFSLMIRGRGTLVPLRAFPDDRYVIRFRRMLEENVAAERLALREQTHGY